MALSFFHANFTSPLMKEAYSVHIVEYDNEDVSGCLSLIPEYAERLEYSGRIV